MPLVRNSTLETVFRYRFLTTGIETRDRQKGSFGKGVLFRKVHFLENLEILETPRLWKTKDRGFSRDSRDFRDSRDDLQ